MAKMSTYVTKLRQMQRWSTSMHNGRVSLSLLLNNTMLDSYSSNEIVRSDVSSFFTESPNHFSIFIINLIPNPNSSGNIVDK